MIVYKYEIESFSTSLNILLGTEGRLHWAAILNSLLLVKPNFVNSGIQINPRTFSDIWISFLVSNISLTSSASAPVACSKISACFSANRLHYWAPGNQNKRDSTDVWGTDQNCQCHGGLIRAPNHHHWDPCKHQPGTISHQCQVTL